MIPMPIKYARIFLISPLPGSAPGAAHLQRLTLERRDDPPRGSIVGIEGLVHSPKRGRIVDSMREVE
jgi:hypothetical protein